MAGQELGNPNAVLRFVEDGLVYRLPWGMEAVRVRAAANQEVISDDLAISDFEMGLAVPAVENGTLNQSAAMLMQAGFNSRIAAIKAVFDGAGEFRNRTELSAWLTSEPVQELTALADWPTRETAAIWKSFVTEFKPPKNSIWQQTTIQLEAEWFDRRAVPASGTEVRILNLQDRLTSIVDANGNLIGHLVQLIRLLSNGVYFASVNSNSNFLDVTFLGAGEDPFLNYDAG